MMDDLIRRQDAIDALQKEINKGIPPFDDVMGSIRCGVRLARNIIEDLPSAEPNLQPTCNQLATDCISRRDAIAMLDECLAEYSGVDKNGLHSGKWCAMSEARTIIEELPSAEPEIIYCGDCKYKDDGIDEDGIPFLKCLNGRSYGGTRINDYCSWAERRTDE